MQFSRLVKKKNVFSELESTEREDVLREIVGRLVQSGEIPEGDLETVVDGLMARERLGTTGIGKGVAIPHFRYEGAEKVLVAVGRSETGVDFSSVDGAPTTVVFLIIAPEAEQDDYLAALRWVSKVARDEYNNKLLMGAKTPPDFIELFQDIEAEG